MPPSSFLAMYVFRVCCRRLPLLQLHAVHVSEFISGMSSLFDHCVDEVNRWLAPPKTCLALGEIEREDNDDDDDAKPFRARGFARKIRHARLSCLAAPPH